jgi:hypothetical protein
MGGIVSQAARGGGGRSARFAAPESSCRRREEEADLEEAIAEADAGMLIPAEIVLQRLREMREND